MNFRINISRKSLISLFFIINFLSDITWDFQIRIILIFKIELFWSYDRSQDIFRISAIFLKWSRDRFFFQKLDFLFEVRPGYGQSERILKKVKANILITKYKWTFAILWPLTDTKNSIFPWGKFLILFCSNMSSRNSLILMENPESLPSAWGWSFSEIISNILLCTNENNWKYTYRKNSDIA